MKIVRDGVVYLQIRDFSYLLDTKKQELLENASFESLFREASDESGVFIVSGDNLNDFIAFRNPESIDYLKSIDDIVDYDEIKDLDCEEMNALRICIINEKNQIAAKLKKMSAQEKNEHPELLIRYKTLTLRYQSLKDVYRFKRGKAKLVLPEGEEELTPISVSDEIKLRLKNTFGKKDNK